MFTNTRLPLFSLFLALAAGCAHREPPPIELDTDWIRPRLDEGAHASLRCVRPEPERIVELSASPGGQVRAWVHPFPASEPVRACADEVAAKVHVGPTASGLRVLIGGDGRLLDVLAPRARALALRSRAIEQVAAVERCRQGLMARRPGTSGRVGLLFGVDAAGAVTRAEVAAATVDAEAAACVGEAARALRLPPIPGEYRYSYLLAPQGVLIAAPDVDPIDAHDLQVAVAAARPKLDACLAIYRTPGRVVLVVQFGNDGAPISSLVERATSGVEEPSDQRADACLTAEGRALRVLPFDGPPASKSIPFTLR